MSEREYRREAVIWSQDGVVVTTHHFIVDGSEYPLWKQRVNRYNPEAEKALKDAMAFKCPALVNVKLHHAAGRKPQEFGWLTT